MFAIARPTPRIWNQLTNTEKSRIDLIMKASLISCAFTTSNNNPYILAGGSQRTLDNDYNVGRWWNPNYREGMLGRVLVAMVYFGGPVPTPAILAGYDHAAFVSQLQSNGFVSAWQTFNWKCSYPSSTAPTGTMIEGSVGNCQFFGSTLNDFMGIYTSLVPTPMARTSTVA
jgi:hypothetical protein